MGSVLRISSHIRASLEQYERAFEVVRGGYSGDISGGVELSGLELYTVGVW